MYLSNDILVNCIQKGLRSNWLSDSAKNIAKNQKELTIRKRNWINSFNSSLSIPIPIPFIQFLFNSNSWNWNWNWYQFQFQFRNWPQPCLLRSGANSRHTSMTRSKHSPTASIRTLAVLRGEFVWPKPHPDFKRVVFLMLTHCSAA